MEVLVTGAAGFIGSHVVERLLLQGHRVRATARRAETAEFLQAFRLNDGAQLEIVEMDLLDSGSVDAAVDGCHTVIHCAAVLMVGISEVQRDLIDPSVAGTSNLCNAIAKSGTVTTIIHTSSVAAIRSSRYENGTVFSVNDWCEDASATLNPYGFAKTEGERVMRDFVGRMKQKERPRLVTIHPSIVFGPIHHPRHLKGSMAYLKHFAGRLPFVLNTHLNFVDVRDVADAHIAALTLGPDGGRMIIHTEGMWMKEIGHVLRRLKPDGRFPVRVLPSWLASVMAAFHPKLSVKTVRSSLGRHVGYDVGTSFTDLQMTPRSIDSTLLDGLDSLP
jgi:nucleoside-diphosphate-sugar epimerase